jgi:hypothetical protein
MPNFYSVGDREAAEETATALTELRKGQHACGFYGEPPRTDRRVTQYIAMPYGWSFGIVERWVYRDDPTEYEMGGGFMDVRQIAALLRRAIR